MKQSINKNELINEFQAHAKDTGSPEVQIVLLTTRIIHLTEHLRSHKKDYHSRYGLIQMTNRRRKHLSYVKRYDLKKYQNLLKQLNLRR